MVTPPDQHHSSGVADVDRHLQGLLLGDNLVWVGDDPRVHDLLEHAFLSSPPTTARVLVVLEDPPPALPKGVRMIDARPGREHADPVTLERAIIEAGRESGSRIVIRSLDVLVRRLGEDRALAFFSRTCPSLFDRGAIAYWRASRPGSGRIVEAIQRLTQCVIEFSGGRMRVLKAEGRPGVEGQIFDMSIEGEELALSEIRAASRLSEGLRSIRAERGLTQANLAHMAGVSSSAISQAEAGRRGLAVETLLILSEALRVPLDDLFGRSHETGYVLARRDRMPPRRGVIPLLDDPNAGLRANLINLGPGERGGPSVVHKGAELVLVSAGLVLIELVVETPVMRAGDALLVTTDAIGGWQNLLPEPASLFWILRD